MSSVLEIADYAAPYKGNFIASLLSLADALRDRGVGTVFLFPPRAKECGWIQEIPNAYPVFFLPEKGGTVGLLRDVCRRYDVRCVHTHFIDRSVYIPLRIACGKIPHIFHAHSLPKFSENDPRLPLRRGLMHTQRALMHTNAAGSATASWSRTASISRGWTKAKRCRCRIRWRSVSDTISRSRGSTRR